MEAHLRAEAGTRGVTAALAALVDQGEDAGKRTADAADDATESLGKQGESADKAAGSADKLGASCGNAAAGLQSVAAAGQQAASIALGVSEAFADAANNITVRLDRITFGLAEEQQRQANDLLETLRQQNLQYDALAQRVAVLRQQFKYLDDEQLRALAQEQEKLDQNLQRKQEQLDAQRQLQREQQASSDRESSAGAMRSEVVHRVEIVAETVDVDSLVHDSRALDKLAKAIVDKFKRSRVLAGG